MNKKQRSSWIELCKVGPLRILHIFTYSQRHDTFYSFIWYCTWRYQVHVQVCSWLLYMKSLLNRMFCVHCTTFKHKNSSVVVRTFIRNHSYGVCLEINSNVLIMFEAGIRVCLKLPSFSHNISTVFFRNSTCFSVKGWI